MYPKTEIPDSLLLCAVLSIAGIYVSGFEMAGFIIPIDYSIASGVVILINIYCFNHENTIDVFHTGILKDMRLIAFGMIFLVPIIGALTYAGLCFTIDWLSTGILKWILFYIPVLGMWVFLYNAYTDCVEHFD